MRLKIEITKHTFTTADGIRKSYGFTINGSPVRVCYSEQEALTYLAFLQSSWAELLNQLNYKEEDR